MATYCRGDGPSPACRSVVVVGEGQRPLEESHMFITGVAGERCRGGAPGRRPTVPRRARARGEQGVAAAQRAEKHALSQGFRAAVGGLVSRKGKKVVWNEAARSALRLLWDSTPSARA